MSLKLYEIAENMRTLAAQIAETTNDAGEIVDDIPADLEAQLDAINMAFEDKADGCCRVRAELLAEARAFDDEIKRLVKLRNAAERRADWLKGYLLRCMLAAGIDKLTGKLFKLRLQRNSRPAISVAAGAEIPEELRRVTVEFDGTKAYDLWKAGEKLPPSVIVKEGCHIRIS